MSASAMDLSSLEKDPRLFLYTSLTAGSSHIITATSRMETILKANRIPFQAIDTATDEKARRLWQRRAGQKKLPGLVKEGYVIGDLEEVEEWNEFGELKENIGPVPASNAAPVGGQVGVNIAPPSVGGSAAGATAGGPAKVGPLGAVNKAPQPVFDKSKAILLPGAEEMAARNKEKENVAALSASEAGKSEAVTSSPEGKKEDSKATKEVSASHPSLDHLSAPASRLQSGTATPAQSEEPKAEEKKEEETTTAAAAMTTDEKDEPAPAPTEKHRGSDVVEAHVDEVKKIESENALAEEDEEDTATKDMAGLKVEGEKTQEQSAAEPSAAEESVKD